MKKYFIPALLGLILLAGSSSCFHHHDITITQTDNEDEYEMEASYRKNQTHDVQIYIDDHFLVNSSVSVKYEPGEDEITLGDKTRFYINSSPGEIRIKIDKRENSKRAYKIVKEVCEDIKDILADD